MARVRLIHWNSSEAASHAALLERSGHVVDASAFGPAALKALKKRPPDVLVIDLTRSPAQGRDLGVLLRKTASTRHVPLVFAGGDEEKVRRVRALLPDATYTAWQRARSAVSRAAGRPVADPVVPASTFAAYAGTPLPKKLGIGPGSVVALVGAPEGFEDTLGQLPDGAVVRRGARGRCDLAIWFARSRREVERRVERLGEFAGRDGLWIAWPKRSSGVASDLTQAAVRQIGLSSGLVDYKVCSIDDTWSGLRFTAAKRG
jgi:CheY-like chemotaxis protein